MIRLVSRNGTDTYSMPVTMAEMAAHLKREDTVEDDEVINGCLLSAIDKAERFTGHVMIDSTYDLFMNSFPAGTSYGYGAATSIYLRRAPLLEVESVTYSDSAGASVVMDSSGYSVGPDSIYLPVSGSWPAANAVTVRFRAGYIDYDTYPPTVGDIPPLFKQAIMIMAANYYGNRDDEQLATPTRIPWGALEDLRLFRIDDSLA